MYRNGIVNAVANARFVEMRNNGVPVRNANRIDMVNVFPPFSFGWRDHGPDLHECFLVTLGMSPTERIAVVQMFQFDLKNGSLNTIHTTVPSDHSVVVFS